MDKKKELCKIAAQILNVANECGKEQGEWILKDSTEFEECITWYICSECGDVGGPEYNYCPNCGADMRGDKDE